MCKCENSRCQIYSSSSVNKVKLLDFYSRWSWLSFEVETQRDCSVCCITHVFRTSSDKTLCVRELRHRAQWRKGLPIMLDWSTWVNYVCRCLMNDKHSRIFHECGCKNTAVFRINLEYPPYIIHTSLTPNLYWVWENQGTWTQISCSH